MSDSTDAILSELAHKLGVGVEHLWPEYVRFVYADGITDLVLATISAIAAWRLYVLFRRISKSEHDMDDKMIPLSFVGLGALIAAVLVMPLLNEGITQVFAPEGAAVYHLVKKTK